MITTPSNTLPLEKQKEEQLKAVENRLLNLINDLREAEKQLVMIQKDTVAAQKDRDYQEELLATRKAQTDELEAKLLELQQAFAALTEANEKNRTLLADQETEHDAKHRALIAREHEILKREAFSAERAANLEQYANTIAVHKLEVEAAQKAFKKAIESVTWK